MCVVKQEMQQSKIRSGFVKYLALPQQLIQQEKYDSQKKKLCSWLMCVFTYVSMSDFIHNVFRKAPALFDISLSRRNKVVSRKVMIDIL